ncbi:hypothetical protein K227x_33880 [Rubripirellula lacrimiformis]|uniref:Uncharacterized protein n=1 Tax=Rubripirellula lacrimiformis TaxID=1930273 RepID=A0A517NCX6_9BACT|nr:hypothetical protein [Rubripirellula lacrimiformis]QDT04990.1 hypothetical protein K227x_33880 [Rubripirellula lacrimiformis]
MKMIFGWMLISVSLVAAGCGQSETASTAGKAAAVDSQYAATSEPDGAMPVGEARESIEDGQDVTLVGVIGGSTDPFVDGLAAFTVVDPKVPYCAADEGCPTPWDYCCTQEQVKDNVATVMIVDDSGNPVAQDARNILNIKELSTVVVTGKAKRDEEGNLTVAANNVFVRTEQ